MTKLEHSSNCKLSDIVYLGCPLVMIGCHYFLFFSFHREIFLYSMREQKCAYHKLFFTSGFRLDIMLHIMLNMLFYWNILHWEHCYTLLAFINPFANDKEKENVQKYLSQACRANLHLPVCFFYVVYILPFCIFTLIYHPKLLFKFVLY